MKDNRAIYEANKALGHSETDELSSDIVFTITFVLIVLLIVITN